MEDLNFVLVGGSHPGWGTSTGWGKLNPNAPCRAVIDWIGNVVWGA